MIIVKVGTFKRKEKTRKSSLFIRLKGKETFSIGIIKFYTLFKKSFGIITDSAKELYYNKNCKIIRGFVKNK